MIKQLTPQQAVKMAERNIRIFKRMEDKRKKEFLAAMFGDKLSTEGKRAMESEQIQRDEYFDEVYNARKEDH